MELREQFPTRGDIQRLKHISFSREQIASLLRVIALYQRGIYHEDEPSRKDRGFIRWLYLQVAAKLSRGYHVQVSRLLS